MMKTIVLIGTSHTYQRADKQCPPGGPQAFQRFLAEACFQYGIQTVAEEMNEQALEEVARKESIPQQVANDLSLKHRFCDPNRAQRAHLGIQTDNQIEVDRFCDPTISQDEVARRKRESLMRRELYWLDRLRTVPESEWPILFICGADHVKSFPTILEERGVIVEHIADDWSP